MYLFLFHKKVLQSIDLLYSNLNSCHLNLIYLQNELQVGEDLCDKAVNYHDDGDLQSSNFYSILQVTINHHLIAGQSNLLYFNFNLSTFNPNIMVPSLRSNKMKCIAKRICVR